LYREEFDETKGAIRILKEGQTIQWPKGRTNNDIQNTTQKTKDRAI